MQSNAKVTLRPTAILKIPEPHTCSLIALMATTVFNQIPILWGKKYLKGIVPYTSGGLVTTIEVRNPDLM